MAVKLRPAFVGTLTFFISVVLPTWILLNFNLSSLALWAVYLTATASGAILLALLSRRVNRGYLASVILFGVAAVCISPAFLVSKNVAYGNIGLGLLPLVYIGLVSSGILLFVFSGKQRGFTLKGVLVFAICLLIPLLVWWCVLAVQAANYHDDPNVRSSPQWSTGEHLMSNSEIIAGAPSLGNCGRVEASRDSANFEVKPCTNSNANYRVIGIEKDVKKCVSDADNVYVSENWVACLDYNWQKGQCLSCDGRFPVVSSCSSDRPKLYLPESVISSSAKCTSDGFVHSVRDFTVCVKRLNQRQ